jgi:hypothetical protein
MASNKGFYRWAGLLFVALLTYGLYVYGGEIWKESGLGGKLLLLAFPIVAASMLLDAFVRYVRLEGDRIHYRSMIGRRTEFHLKDIVHSRVLWNGMLSLEFRSGESLTLFTTDSITTDLKKKLNLK